MGCSLPVKNSPMVNHNSESPDFTIGRWILDPAGRISNNTDFTSTITNIASAPSLLQLQGPKDRIIYHDLRPQNRVQTLRLKLFLRVRLYDEVHDKFNMDTIDVPMTKTDWWHCRLHFLSKE